MPRGANPDPEHHLRISRCRSRDHLAQRWHTGRHLYALWSMPVGSRGYIKSDSAYFLLFSCAFLVPRRANPDPEHHLSISRCRSRDHLVQRWHTGRHLYALWSMPVGSRGHIKRDSAYFLLFSCAFLMPRRANPGDPKHHLTPEHLTMSV
jgi:transposase